MRKTALLFAAAALLGAAPAAAHAQRYTLTCQSRSGRQQFCRADTRGGVRLTRQLSDTPCRQGRSWWSTGDGVVVTNGCRAQFEVYRPNGSGYGGYGNRSGGYGNNGRYGNGGYGNGGYGENGRYGNGGYGQNGRYGNGGYNDRWAGNASSICRRAAASRVGTSEGEVRTWERKQHANKVEYGWQGGRYADGTCTVDRNGRVSLHVDHNNNRGRDGAFDRRHGYHN